ncbi:hypothetical protein [Homoserinibacter sp. YIM 151385]|uniref:hypothetical protein n=1 Tax=Homoserinibacter sp. YIM 151385 TaxID=2985506 RepID=UPI0022F09068|nr:hypothetical protein [Homoserinibacter sp. YIM 151385]WBU36895.1 hypothetical protein OF852_08100 [Homoserinibacter sp. YIM 151385]
MPTAFVTMVCSMVPIFGALYFFAIPAGNWPVVLVAQVAIVAACATALARQLTLFSAVTDEALLGNGIATPIVRVPLGEIREVLLVDTYRGSSPDLTTQLLVRDEHGRRLFRMRGNYWNRGDLQALAEALPVEAVHLPEAMSMRAFYRRFPGAAYWFEDKPVVRVAVITAIIVSTVAVASIVMAIVGVPIAGS